MLTNHNSGFILVHISVMLNNYGRLQCFIEHVFMWFQDTDSQHKSKMKWMKEHGLTDRTSSPQQLFKENKNQCLHEYATILWFLHIYILHSDMCLPTGVTPPTQLYYNWNRLWQIDPYRSVIYRRKWNDETYMTAKFVDNCRAYVQFNSAYMLCNFANIRLHLRRI